MEILREMVFYFQRAFISRGMTQVLDKYGKVLSGKKKRRQSSKGDKTSSTNTDTENTTTAADKGTP